LQVVLMLTVMCIWHVVCNVWQITKVSKGTRPSEHVNIGTEWDHIVIRLMSCGADCPWYIIGILCIRVLL